MTDEAGGLSNSNEIIDTKNNNAEDIESNYFSVKKAGQTRANHKRRKLRSQRTRLRRR